MRQHYVHALFVGFTAMYVSSLGLLWIFKTYYYQFNLLWLIAALSYILLFWFLNHDDILRYLDFGEERIRLLTVIGLATFLRILFSLEQPVISTDVYQYANYGKMLLGGLTPYKQAWIPYPPFFTIVIWSLGLVFGPTYQPLRAFFILCDLLVVGLVFLLGKKIFDSKNAFAASLCYALFPLPLIEVAWSGHFDVIPALVTILALFFSFKKSIKLSALSLGSAVMLKLYPILALPIIIKDWIDSRSRIWYIVFFLLPIVILAFPFFVISQSQLISQVVASRVVQDIGVNSLSFYFANMGISPYVLEYLLFGSIGFVYGIVLSKNKEKENSNIGLLLYIMLGALYFALGFLNLQFPSLFPGGIPQSWYFPFAMVYRPAFFYSLFGLFVALCGIGLIVYSFYLYSKRIKIEMNTLFMLVVVLLIFIFSLRVYFSWYYLWVVPFILLLRQDKRVKALLLIACLAVYPTCYYIYDFPKIGLNEHQAWGDDFQNLANWSFETHMFGSAVEGIDYGLNKTDSGADFWMKSHCSHQQYNEYVSMISDKFHIDLESYPLLVVCGLKAGLNPTFGQRQAFEITVDGLSVTDQEVTQATAFPFWPHLGNVSSQIFVGNLKALNLKVVERVRITLIYLGDNSNETIHLYLNSIYITEGTGVNEISLIFAQLILPIGLSGILGFSAVYAFSFGVRRLKAHRKNVSP